MESAICVLIVPITEVIASEIAVPMDSPKAALFFSTTSVTCFSRSFMSTTLERPLVICSIPPSFSRYVLNDSPALAGSGTSPFSAAYSSYAFARLMIRSSISSSRISAPSCLAMITPAASCSAACPSGVPRYSGSEGFGASGLSGSTGS